MPTWPSLKRRANPPHKPTSIPSGAKCAAARCVSTAATSTPTSSTTTSDGCRRPPCLSKGQAPRCGTPTPTMPTTGFFPSHTPRGKQTRIPTAGCPPHPPSTGWPKPPPRMPRARWRRCPTPLELSPTPTAPTGNPLPSPLPEMWLLPFYMTNTDGARVSATPVRGRRPTATTMRATSCRRPMPRGGQPTTATTDSIG